MRSFMDRIDRWLMGARYRAKELSTSTHQVDVKYGVFGSWGTIMVFNGIGSAERAAVQLVHLRVKEARRC